MKSQDERNQNNGPPIKTFEISKPFPFKYQSQDRQDRSLFRKVLSISMSPSPELTNDTDDLHMQAQKIDPTSSHAPPADPHAAASLDDAEPPRSVSPQSSQSGVMRFIEERRKEVAEVDTDLLGSIASRLRAGLPCRYIQDEDAIGGGYNLIYEFEFSDGVLWIARVPSKVRALRPLEDPLSQQSMQSMIDTVQYIIHNTSIPVPQIYGFDVSCENELGRPYVFMEKAYGQPLSGYMDGSWDQYPDGLERIVRKWGEYAIELATLRFDSIGSLFRRNDSEHEVRELITPYHLNLDSNPNVNCGPFKSTVDYLLALSRVKRLEPGPHPPSFGGHLRMSLVESLLGYFVDTRYMNGPFVVSHTDWDFQNVLVDLEKGEITGIIDWDFATVLPLQSHLVVPRTLNAEFLPASEYEQFTDDYPHILDFSKRFRKVYEDSMVEAAKTFDVDYPVEDILDRSLMYGLFENALSQVGAEKYLPALWNHVYGGGMDSLEEVRGEMRSAYWAGWMADKWKVKVERKKAQKVKPETIQKEVKSPLVGEISIFPPPRRSTAPPVDEIPITRPENPPPVEEIPITQEPRRSEPPIGPTPQPKRRGIFAAAIDQWKEGRDEWFDWVEARQKRVAEIVAERRRRLKRKATLEKLESNTEPKKRSVVKSIFFGRS
jgi:hypothetical protein